MGSGLDMGDLRYFAEYRTYMEMYGSGKKHCLLDPIAPLPILDLRGLWDISTLITTEHEEAWVALKDVVSTCKRCEAARGKCVW